MNTAYLLTGGNLGDRPENLAFAGKLIEQFCGKILQNSAIYESAAWGYTDQPAFYNQALLIQTLLPAATLMEKLLYIENLMGRKRTIHMGPRIIDIDILFFNNEIINTPDLIIPHPRIQARKFVLMPLAEIAKSYIHPLLHKTIGELLTICPDDLDVHKIE